MYLNLRHEDIRDGLDDTPTDLHGRLYTQHEKELMKKLLMTEKELLNAICIDNYELISQI